MLKSLTRAVAALALSCCALAAAAQTYPSVPGPGGTKIAPAPTAVTGLDSVTSAPCIVGASTTCQLPVTGGGSGGGSSAPDYSTAAGSPNTGHTSTVQGCPTCAAEPISAADGQLTTAGSTSDPAYTGSGSGSLVGIGKGSFGQEQALNGALGAKGDAACSGDSGSCDLIALIERTNARITAVIQTLGSPLQTGGAVSVSNAGFSALGSAGTALANDAADGGVLTSDEVAPTVAVSATGATYSGGTASFSATGQAVVLDARHYGSIALTVQGSGLGSIGIYCSNSASGPWISAAGSTANNVGSFQEGSAVNANSQWLFNTCGRYMEMASTSWGTGTTTVGVAMQRDPRPLPSVFAQLAGGGAQLQPTSSATYAIAESVQQASSGYAFKTSAGNLYGWDLDEGGTAGYFCFLDAAAVPAASATITPKFCISAAVNSTTHIRQDIPDRFASGIVIVSTSSVTAYTAVPPAIIGATYQ